jgi:hypothetical protein
MFRSRPRKISEHVIDKNSKTKAKRKLPRPSDSKPQDLASFRG